jgi:hypothetical protein
MRMKATRRRFTADIVAAIHNSKILGIRAGQQPHRFIGIWVVVVEGRVFVRSWSLKPRSWYRTFLEDPYGAVQIAGRELAVRAVRTRSDRLKDAVDRAYIEKYKTPRGHQVCPRPRTCQIQGYDHGTGAVVVPLMQT